MRLFLTAVSIVSLLVGCADNKVTPDELKAYIQNERNGLLKKSNLEGTSIAVSYRPTDLWIFQETKSQLLDSASYQQLYTKYAGNHYFILSLSKDNQEALQTSYGAERYRDLVQTLSFRMDQFVTLTTSARDTIPVGYFMLDRTYGLSGATNVLFVFDKAKSKGAEWVQFNMNEFGLGTGNQYLRFSTKDIEQAPTIDFEVTKK
jgi:hypothetical protein